MTSEVERYRAMPMAGKWEYASRLAAADDLLPRAFRGPVWNEARQMFEQKIMPGKVFLAIEYGAMLGLPALAAINGIHVIEGKPSLSAATMSGLIRAAGHRLRIKKAGTIAGGDFSVTVTLIRSDDPDEPISTTWTPQRALVAELIDGYAQQGGQWVVRAKKDNWRKQPETMLTWRAMSECCRIGADDVFMGAAYTPDELGELDVEEEDVVEEQLAAIAAAPTAAAADKLFRSWTNEGLTVSPKVSAAAMGRVATLTAQEVAARAAAPAPDEGPVGAGEKIAEPVADDAPEALEAADRHQADDGPQSAAGLDADEKLAQTLMADEEFAAWIAARRNGATS